jgi:hypothetical protein
MWGESSANDELTHDFRGRPEGTPISYCRLFRLFAENWRCSNFGVLQHYPPASGHRRARAACPKSAKNRRGGTATGFPLYLDPTKNIFAFQLSFGKTITSHVSANFAIVLPSFDFRSRSFQSLSNATEHRPGLAEIGAFDILGERAVDLGEFIVGFRSSIALRQKARELCTGS